MKSLCYSIAFVFNLLCTYHAQASQGCEQEKMDYTLNNKRRVIRLVMQWAAVHGDHLQEEEDSVAFLQVSWDNTYIKKETKQAGGIDSDRERVLQLMHELFIDG